MKCQQLLLLCVVMGLAVAMAQEQQDAELASANKHYKKKHHEYKHEDEYYPEDDGHDYPKPHYYPKPPRPSPSPKPSPSPAPKPPPSPAPPVPPPDCCDCDLLPGFKDRTLSCVNCKHGVLGLASDASCVTNATQTCIKIDKWSCTYQYRPATYQCADNQGPCDQDDFCTGKSSSCADVKRPDTYVCKTSDNPCIKPTKCNGRDNYCPGPKRVKNGVPCSLEYPGLYQEAIDDDGKVYLQSKVAKEEAEKKGWVKCHRCYDGECKAFKYEWIKHKEEKKSSYKGGYKGHTYAYDEEAVAEGQASTAGKKTKYGGEFEPEFYCHKRHEFEGYYDDDEDKSY